MILRSRDLRVQLALAAALFACAMVSPLPVLALLLLVVEGLLLTAGAGSQRALLLAGITALPFVLVNAALLGPTPLATLGPITLYRQGFEAGLGFAGRGLVAVGAGLWVLRSASVRDAMQLLRRWPRAALAASATLRFVPLAAEDWGRIREAQAMRGHRMARGVRGSTGVAPLLVPLLVGTVRRGHTLQEAIEASAFGSGPRTERAFPRLLGGDVALLGLAALLLALTGWHVARTGGLA